MKSADPTSLIRVVLEGARNVATDRAPTGAAMPAFGWKQANTEIAAELIYIRDSWGNAAAAESAADVKSLRRQLLRN